MDVTSYPFDQERFEEMARLKKQAIVLDNLIPLPRLAKTHEREHYRVLDLACGPGTRAMTIAKQCPNAQVYGLDFSERMIGFATVQARADHVENVVYQVGNALAPLPFERNSLDFIHARLLQCFMPIAAWPDLLTECRRVLRPGGIIQLIESTRPECNKPANTALSAMAAQMGVSMGTSGSPDGQSFGICNMLAHFLASASFAVEEERAFSVNYSAHTPAHQIWCEDVIAVLRQYPEILAKQGKPKEEIERIEQLCVKAISEMAEDDFCASMFLLSVVAHKPAN